MKIDDHFIHLALAYVKTCIQRLGEAETRLLPTRSFVKINPINKAVKFLDANNFVDVSRRGVYVRPEFINLIGLKNGLEAKVRFYLV